METIQASADEAISTIFDVMRVSVLAKETLGLDCNNGSFKLDKS